MSADADCLFCRIVSGDIPATVVLDNEHVVAFRDVSPQAPVHVLVIPKRHVPDVAALVDAAPAEVSALFAGAAQVARDDGLDDGYRMVANTGKRAHQTVFHAHVHVLGGRDLGWPPG